MVTSSGHTPQNLTLDELRDDVVEIEVDEERLDVLVRLHAGPPLRIEPRYPGVEIHELVRTLNDARHKAGHL